MIKINKEESIYLIIINAKDGKDIYLGGFVKSCDDNNNYNNVLTLYSSPDFKINAKLLSYIADTIQEKFGDIDFAIMTSDIFKTWKESDRYKTENII